MFKALLRHRPSPAMIVAVLAMVLACAGTATAARLITGKQIKNSSITSTDVKNGSLLRGDFKSGQVPTGPQGPQGLRGPAGPAGAKGTNGFGVLRYPEGVFAFSNGDSDSVGASCPAGTYATGGSAWAADSATGAVDHPEVITAQGLAFSLAGVATGYFADVTDVASGDVDVVVDVACANAQQALPSVRHQGKRLR